MRNETKYCQFGCVPGTVGADPKGIVNHPQPHQNIAIDENVFGIPGKQNPPLRKITR